ncbi:glycosyltransferase [Sphingobium phenoxybenzoativorans]|uniref:glycosyltransferase n=1 Tax=Sphingobium phenoxybenzoativorans TaxID=1592790 RepID=UPI0008726669|nr:glycosyltransferase [Sphingobium phenoxybenzoativorans]
MADRPYDGRPRLLHLHSSFNLGGKEARAVRLMNLWGDRAEHAIVSGVPGAMGARAAIAPDIAVDFPDAPPLTGRPGLSRFLALARFMRGYDLVLTYNWGAVDGVMAHRIFHRLLALPPLIHHEDGFNEDEAAGLKPARNRYRRIALAGADALVVPSRRLEGIALNAWRQPRGKVRLIPNGIDLARYAAPPQPDALPGFVRAPGKLVVGTLAGLRAVKNIPRLVRAVAAHRERLQLVVVGEGPERDAILREAEAHGLSDLHMAGFLSDPWKFVGLFDIFALSSDSEQFPISLVEAMAAGLPVVSTDVGDVADMVAPANRRFVIPLEEETGLAAALGELAANAALRDALGKANRVKALDAFGEPQMLGAYASLYGKSLARPDVLL